MTTASSTHTSNPRTYEVRTFGCQMNVHDSERISGLLEEAGYAAAGEGVEPDLIVFNTCAVRENADDLGWANLGPIGSYISKINPDFDSRLYGYGKLSDLIKSFDIFEHRTDNNQLQVRRRKSADKPTERPSENSRLMFFQTASSQHTLIILI